MAPLRRRFLKLWRTDLTFAEIAELLGVSDRVLYKWRIELGLPERQRGRRKL